MSSNGWLEARPCTRRTRSSASPPAISSRRDAFARSDPEFAHTLLDTTAGKAPAREGTARGLRGVVLLTGIAVPCLLALTGAALWLPGSAIAHALVQGAR